MTCLLGAVDRFFAPQPQHAMVAARIGLGTVLFLSYLVKLPHVQEMYGPWGFGGRELLQLFPADSLARHPEKRVNLLLWTSSPELIWALWTALLLASLAFALGAWTRTAGVAALLLHTLLHARNTFAYLDWSVMIKAYLVYVILSPSGRFFSLDAWRRRRRGGPPPPAGWPGPAWPLRMLQVHVCTMYLVAGFSRVTAPVWISGQAVFVAVYDRYNGRFDVDWWAWRQLLTVLGRGVYLLEPLAPFLLWVPRLGVAWALGLIAMHVGTEVLANVGWWQFVMVTALLAFLPPRWLAAFFARLGARGASLS